MANYRKKFKKRKLALGGEVDPPVKYVTDKNDPRLKAYNDSLSAYNAGEEFMWEGDPTYGGLYKFNKVKNPGDYYIETAKESFNTTLNPSEIYEVNSGSDIFFPRWKKPVQPVEYRPNPPKPSGEFLKRKGLDLFTSTDKLDLPNKKTLDAGPIIMPEARAYYNAQQNTLYPPDWMVKKKDTPGWDRYSDEEFKKLQENEEVIPYKNTYATGGKIMSKYKKLKKRKLAAGGPTDYSAVYGGIDAVGSAVGVPALGQLVKLQDGLQGTISNVGQNAIQKKAGLSDEEAAIAFQGSEKFGRIPIIGNNLGNLVDGVNIVTGKTKSRLKDFREKQTLVQANNSPSYDIRYALGGSLNDINGPTHEEGGVDQAPSIETEGGETQKDDYIFSDRLKYPGKKTTFAKLSKRIRDKYTGKRPNDKISKEAEERELATLADVQEIVRGEIMESAVQMAYGGSMKKKMYGGGNIPNDPDNILSKLERRYETENRYGYINERASIPNLSQYTQPTDLKIYPNIEPELNIGIDRLPTTEIPTMDIPGLTISPQTTNPIKPVPSKDFGVEGLDASGNVVSYNPDLFPDTNSSYNPENFMGADEFANTKTQLSGDNINKSNFGGADGLDYASMGLQVANAAFDLYQNRKIDPVNYKRAKPTMVDNYKAKILANQEANRGLSAGQASINQTGDTASRTLSNARALAIKGAQGKAETTAKLMQEEELQNAGILNNFEQFNTQIANLEKDAYAQNKGQVLSNRSMALNNLTKNLTGSAGTYKKYQTQQMITKLLGTDNWKLENGNIVTYNDAGEKISSFSLT